MKYNADAIKVARFRQKLSAAQAALILDITEAEYEKIEQNQDDLSEAQLQKLALLYRVSVEKLTTSTSKKKAKPKKRTQKERYENPDYVSPEDLEEARKTMPDATEESVRFLRFIAGIVVENTLREVERESRLDKEPNGFRFEDAGFTCWICQGSAKGGWYDQYGLKCAGCQEAVDKGLVPGEITRNHDLYFTQYQLESYFGMGGKTARQFTKAGLLHPRTVGNHQTIYITAQQNNFLPPKDLLQDSDWHQTTPDPKALIAPYGIAQYIHFSKPQDSP